MMRLYRAQHLVEASHIKNLLDSAGIRAFLRNENLVRLSGEVPFDQTWPEVWIEDDALADEARALIGDIRTSQRHSPAWNCSACGESLEGQFSACWHCGTERFS
jgi:Putative prokaryotic signal transducing protein